MLCYFTQSKYFYSNVIVNDVFLLLPFKLDINSGQVQRATMTTPIICIVFASTQEVKLNLTKEDVTDLAHALCRQLVQT